MKLYYDPDDLDEGLNVVWKEYIKEVKNGLSHEEKKWLRELPSVDIEELMKLKRYYIDENEKAKSYIQKHKASQENYLKWLTANLDKKYKPVATQRVQEDTSKLRSATLAQIKNVLFIQWIDEAIKNNKAIKDAGSRITTGEKHSSARNKKSDTDLKNIENYNILIKAYLKVVQDTQYCEPPIKALHEYSGLSKAEIKRRLGDILFLGILQKELEKKINYAKKKETREVWIHAERIITELMHRIEILYTDEREQSMTDARRAIIEKKRMDSEEDDDRIW